MLFLCRRHAPRWRKRRNALNFRWNFPSCWLVYPFVELPRSSTAKSFPSFVLLFIVPIISPGCSCYFVREMQISSMPRSLALVDLPTDILEHVIFENMNKSSLAVCSLLCHRFRKIIKTMNSSITKQKFMAQKEILENIYKIGSMDLLDWFSRTLRYPKLSMMHPIQAGTCLQQAAQSMRLQYL